MRPGQISLFDKRKYPLGRPEISIAKIHNDHRHFKDNLQMHVLYHIKIILLLIDNFENNLPCMITHYTILRITDYCLTIINHY